MKNIELEQITPLLSYFTNSNNIVVVCKTDYAFKQYPLFNMYKISEFKEKVIIVDGLIY